MTLLAVVTIPVAALTLYVAPFVPIVTAFATKMQAPGWLKIAVTAALAVVVAAVTTAIDSGSDLVLTWKFVGTIAVTFATSMGGYLVLRKPVVGPIERRTADVGVSA